MIQAQSDSVKFLDSQEEWKEALRIQLNPKQKGQEGEK